MLSLVTVALVALAARPTTITMYSDAQCPCSAQFVSDIKHILDNEQFADVDLQQYFVPKCMDAIDSCARTGINATNDDLLCIHGAEECLGHRYFLCAQQQAGGNRSVPRSGWLPPSYRASQQWLDFQACSYGTCQLCDVFTGLFCLTPCATYTTFTKPDKNDIMETCAAKIGLSWPGLQACAGGELADVLQIASATVARTNKAFYGTKGLPVVTVGPQGAVAPTHVRTAQKIPLVCGPTPLEVLGVLCSELANDGVLPLACASTAAKCAAIQNATRLPECR